MVAGLQIIEDKLTAVVKFDHRSHDEVLALSTGGI
jgi:hypothetical protein